MRRASHIFLITIGILGLVAVRIFEDDLFYDPFLQYFQEAERSSVFPQFNFGRLAMSHLFRFCLNLFFSALVLQGFFKNRNWTLQGSLLMIIAFAVALPAYLYFVHTHFEIGYLFSFYMRRFVIQPMILLLLIPIFYFRKYQLEQTGKL